MKNNFLFIILLLGSMSVHANNFEKYYEPREDFVLVEPIYLKPTEEPELQKTFSWSEFEIARENLISKGYVSIGASKFSASKTSEKLALDQAKKLKATYILTLTEPANNEMFYRRGDDLNKLDWAYDYIAVYGVKDKILSNLILGITIRDLNSEEKKQFQRNTGGLVDSVYENSRAYIANILKNDVITHINQTPLIRNKEFLLIRDKELQQSKTLNFSILRLVNGQLKELIIPIKVD